MSLSNSLYLTKPLIQNLPPNLQSTMFNSITRSNHSSIQPVLQTDFKLLRLSISQGDFSRPSTFSIREYKHMHARKNEGDASKKLPMAFWATMIPRTMYHNGSANVSRGSFDPRRLYKGAIPKVDGITCMELRRSKKNGGKAVRVEGADRRVADSVTKGISRVCVSDAALYCPDAGNVWLGSAYYHFHWNPRYGTHRDTNFSLTALGLSIISLLSRNLPREKVRERERKGRGVSS